MSSSRRRFLASGAAASIGVLEWLGYFDRHGVPGTAKDWGMARARAQEENNERFLLYWFLEGGWDSFSCFSPVHTPNHSALHVPAGELAPQPGWSSQFYRAKNYGLTADYAPPSTVQGIEHGHLAADARPLFDDMCVVSSLQSSTFHSGSRLDWHYGHYPSGLSPRRARDANERSIMQAFAEQRGASFLLPHVSWHRWLSDGELDVGQYPEGTGYYEKLGPAYAHTIYGRTPKELKARLAAVGDVHTAERQRLLRDYTDNLHAQFLQGRDGASVRAFASALAVKQQLSDRQSAFDLTNLFGDAGLKAAFGVGIGDDLTSAQSINGNPARSKETPHIRVQAMMAYELMRAKVSCALWLESRDVRCFDDHRQRRTVLSTEGNADQLSKLRTEAWQPLTALVAQLKTTEMPGQPGVSMFDRTTIVLTSEMGRTLQGNVDSILASTSLSADAKYQAILDQDVSQHWHVNAACFLGGNVKGATQFGRVGSQTLEAIPVLPDGSLDPNYDAATGVLQGTKHPQSFVPDAGHVYATALSLAGVDPTGIGKNDRPALGFVKRTV